MVRKSGFLPAVCLTVVWALQAVSTQAATAPAASEKPAGDEKLYIYNWYDYIAEDTVPNFEKKSGINVTYDVFDSNDILEAKLLSGQSGYDIVVPSHDYLANHIKAGIYEPLDKSKLSNYGNLDPKAMQLMAEVDPGNTYGIPYLWQTTGLAINPAKVKEVLGDDAPLDSWALVFEPKYMEKLKKCGVGFMDAPTEVFPAMLRYMGKNPNSRKSGDFRAASARLQKVSPYVSYFNSSRQLTDLANGDICVGIVWSGDVLIAQERADAAKNGVKLEYVIPKEGAAVSYDVLAIPKSAENKENAYKFLNYLLQPKVAADITNYVYYATPNKAATPFIEKELLNNKGIYPKGEVEKTLYLFKPLGGKLRRLVTREWTRIISGQ